MKLVLKYEKITSTLYIVEYRLYLGTWSVILELFPHAQNPISKCKLGNLGSQRTIEDHKSILSP